MLACVDPIIGGARWLLIGYALLCIDNHLIHMACTSFENNISMSLVNGVTTTHIIFHTVEIRWLLLFCYFNLKSIYELIVYILIRILLDDLDCYNVISVGTG